jgi:adenylyltransferase/sulfurtransferase
MFRFELSGTTLDIPALARSMADHSSGALATFEGWVRDNNEGQRVDGLDYEVFETLAISEGETILAEAREKYGVRGIRAVHRHGSLALGDCAVWVGVVAAHRDEAFRACRYVIDQVKHRLPIWKKEHYVDGTAEWVNCKHAGHAPEAHDRHHVHAAPNFGEAQFYARQVRLPEIGEAGQAKLKAARVLIVGAGGLGAPASLMLAAAGVGTIGIAEFDRLEPSNLHRQILYAAADVGRSKAELASERLKSLNPFITINIHPNRVTVAGLNELLAGYDLVLDCTDNFSTKYLLGDAAILCKVPVVQASIHRFEGQLMTIDPASEGGCLRCLWPEPPPQGMVGNCAEVGVLGVVPGLFGTMQATEALKHILSLPGGLERHLLIMDALTFESRRITRRKDPDCPLCGEFPTILTLAESDRAPHELHPTDLTPEMLASYRVVDLREPEERAALPLPGAEHAPFSRFDAKNPPFDKDRPVLLVCARGGRSNSAAEELRGQGWQDVFSLIGGAASLLGLHREAVE